MLNRRCSRFFSANPVKHEPLFVEFKAAVFKADYQARCAVAVGIVLIVIRRAPAAAAR
jgi:hypothetical protein